MKQLNGNGCSDTILSRVLLICSLLLLFLVQGCKKTELTDDIHSRPIRELAGKADRLLITKGRSPDFFSVNTKDIKSLSETLEIESFEDGFDCLCNAEIIFYFYQGEELIMALGHHYNGSLRWHDAEWNGDAVLSRESLRRLLAWVENAFAVSEKLKRGSYTPPALE